MADSTKLLMFGGAAVAVWWFYLRTPATTSAPAAVIDPNAVLGANTIAAIQARVIAAAKAPAEGLAVDDWGWTLNNELAPLGKVAPDPMPIFQAAIPGFDRSQLIPVAQYWTIMTPALKASTGLAGLGLYGFGRGR